MSRPPQPIKHGTWQGYLQHRRRRPPEPNETCQGACKRAWSRYTADRRKNKGAP